MTKNNESQKGVDPSRIIAYVAIAESEVENMLAHKYIDTDLFTSSRLASLACEGLTNTKIYRLEITEV